MVTAETSPGIGSRALAANGSGETEQGRESQIQIRLEPDRFATMASVVPGAFASLRRIAPAHLEVTYASPSFRALFGASPDDPRTDAAVLEDGILAEDHARLVATLAEAERDGAPFHGDYRVDHPIRGSIWVEVHAGRARDPDGGSTWHCVLLDVTERTEAVRRLSASKALLRSVVETAPDFLANVSRDHTVRFVNRAAPGFDLDTVVGARALEFFPDEHREAAATMIDRVFATGERASGELPARPGPGEPVRWFDTRIGPVVEEGEVVAVTICSTDVTERRQAEQARLEAEARYRMLVELLPDAVFINTQGTVTFCNPAFLTLVGAEREEEVIGRAALDYFETADQDRIRRRIATMRETGCSVPPVEHTLRTHAGGRKRVSATATWMGGPETGAVLVVLHDVTEKQRTEQLLASVLESVEDAIVTIDAGGVIRAINPATCRTFQRARHELLGAPLASLIPEGLPTSDGRDQVGVRGDGSTFPAEVTVTTFSLDGAEHQTCVIRDVTERHKLEDQFRQAHKMEAFGQLAGGVAHDFNNLLTVILVEAEELLADTPPDSPVASSLRGIQEAGERAATMTSQLLALSRKTVLDPRVLDVNDVVRQTEKMLRRLIGEDIQLVMRLEEEVLRVNVDPGQLSQVLMNLAVNARDAMSRGGRLDLETSSVAFDEGSARTRGAPRPGGYVKITVRDTGEGMTPEVKERVFQPFFTTKEVGKGTGLGLAVVHGIVGQSGGFVALESEPGEGAQFDVYLPVATASEPPAATVLPVRSAEVRGRVLLVEDDDAVRRVARSVLSGMGCTVHVAHDGADALRLLEAGGIEIDALITDVVMPGLDGLELVARVRARHPGLKTLFVSGYADDELLRRGGLPPEVHFLAKPFTGTSLHDAVHRLLG